MSRLPVLIADDDATARNFLKAFLRKFDYDCVLASDGEQAWQAFQSAQPAMILADWLMPKLSGLELCRMIRAERRPRYPYVILVTALSGKGSYLEGMDAGADDFVTKPYDLDEMAARLRVAERIISLQTEVRQLEGLLPVCSYCRRIRDDRDAWSTLEQFVARHTDVLLSHSICPDCYGEKVAPEIKRLGVANVARRPA
jgi:DNA-binding response OmpR family regulator